MDEYIIYFREADQYEIIFFSIQEGEDIYQPDVFNSNVLNLLSLSIKVYIEKFPVVKLKFYI
jgi:hypothetical protein